jgi:surface protein
MSNSIILNSLDLDDCMSVGGGGAPGGGSTPSKPKWTGHADAEGLKAIGWTDEDIAYYQAYGVNWNEEDDEYHKVTDDNKALYGVLTAKNISTYKERIVYLPKIDTSSVTNMSNMFYSCSSLTAIPLLDTSGVTNMSKMFNYCSSLTAIPLLDTSSVTSMSYMFDYCSSLTTANLKGVALAYQLNNSALLSKESLLYLINNEAATSAITIKLASYAYNKWATDPDIVAALANHPNISISK